MQARCRPDPAVLTWESSPVLQKSPRSSMNSGVSVRVLEWMCSATKLQNFKPKLFGEENTWVWVVEWQAAMTGWVGNKANLQTKGLRSDRLFFSLPSQLWWELFNFWKNENRHFCGEGEKSESKKLLNLWKGRRGHGNDEISLQWAAGQPFCKENW